MINPNKDKEITEYWALIEDYKGGARVPELARKYNLGKQAVLRRLISEDVTLRRDDHTQAAMYGYLPHIVSNETTEMQRYWLKTNTVKRGKRSLNSAARTSR